MKADVILNDIANAQLDAASINTNHASSIVPLSASCACCESLEELMALCKTASSGKGDLLVLELNGTADPLAIIENFSLLKDSLSFSPMMQICMVDARKWGNRDQLTPIEKRQMEASSLHFLSYTDLATEDDITRVENLIEDQFPQSQRITKERLSKALVSCTQKSGENISEFDTSESFVFTIDVEAVNNPPTFDKGDDITIDEDDGTVNFPWATNMDDGDPELDQLYQFVLLYLPL